MSTDLVTKTGSVEIVSIDHDVKMVIWDLDDTLWNGVLAEDEIEMSDERAEIVKTLAARGIVSSIVSNNNYEAAKDVLERAGVWDYFVFPSISYDPKGKRVSQIIRQAGLRPDNVLFVDDNTLNREEVRYFNSGIMLAQPAKFLPVMLSHARLRGKPDSELKRLEQYRLLERKIEDQETTNLSNEEFLRASDIRVSFDFDVERHFDRIVELVNRANQLNYTKVRLATDADVLALKLTFNVRGISAACISCRDRYGDYEVVGFYALKKRSREFRLIHFVFSCRTMNMGIEQFVYQYLGKPDIAVVPEVAYGLQGDTVDWISVSGSVASGEHVGSENKLVLVGGCELQQLAAYCSSNRTEFVNKVAIRDGDEYRVRYDDPYFFITDRAILNRSELFKGLDAWTHEDALLFDQSMSEAKIIILAMFSSLTHPYVVTKDEIRVRIEAPNIDLYLRKRGEWFKDNCAIVHVPTKERLALLQKSFAWANQHSSTDAIIFLIGAATHRPRVSAELSYCHAYNSCCLEFCRTNAKFKFVDVNSLVLKDQVTYSQHLTPAGYRALSTFIMNSIDAEKSRS